MDLKLVRKYLPSVQAASGSPSTIGQDCISINPKAKSYSYMEPVVRSLPHARHLFMYRDVREVSPSAIRGLDQLSHPCASVCVVECWELSLWLDWLEMIGSYVSWNDCEYCSDTVRQK